LTVKGTATCEFGTQGAPRARLLRSPRQRADAVGISRGRMIADWPGHLKVTSTQPPTWPPNRLDALAAAPPPSPVLSSSGVRSIETAVPQGVRSEQQAAAEMIVIATPPVAFSSIS
jgi:hypothetical protein